MILLQINSVTSLKCFEMIRITRYFAIRRWRAELINILVMKIVIKIFRGVIHR